jgi:subtilase family serine protease
MLVALASCGARVSTPLRGFIAGVRTIPAASGCTYHKSDRPSGRGLTPNQLAGAYGVSGLWKARYLGQGRRVALIEIGSSLDRTAFVRFSACYGPFATPIERLIGGGPKPAPGGEGIFDPEVVAAIAPRARIYMFESRTTNVAQVLPKLLGAALTAHETGGRTVDTISISFGLCESIWTAAQLHATQLLLRRAQRDGVAVFVAAGNSGSATSYVSAGKPACISHAAINVKAVKRYVGVSLGLGYPGSSPLVTSVGGTELAVNGAVASAGAPAGGTITDEVVWDEAVQPGMFLAGGGGKSKLFTVGDAPWERFVGVSGQEGKPDLSALAGSPNYFGGATGTSGASPLMAGAVAVLDGYLTAHRKRPTGFLDPTLYRIAADRPIGAQVFNDVVHGNNDILSLGCCSAKPGYDEASGLGSLNIAALSDVLLDRLSPGSAIKLTASPVGAAGSPESIQATTDNVLFGTSYEINIYVRGKLVRRCMTSPCRASIAAPARTSGPYAVTADVAPAQTKPFSAPAIASKQIEVGAPGPRAIGAR